MTFIFIYFSLTLFVKDIMYTLYIANIPPIGIPETVWPEPGERRHKHGSLFLCGFILDIEFYHEFIPAVYNSLVAE